MYFPYTWAYISRKCNNFWENISVVNQTHDADVLYQSIRIIFIFLFYFLVFFRNNRRRKKLYMFLSWMTSSNMIRIINIWRIRCIHENEILIKFIRDILIHGIITISTQGTHYSLYPTDCAIFCVLQTQNSWLHKHHK